MKFNDYFGEPRPVKVNEDGINMCNNVINNVEYKKRVEAVFEDVANIVKHTLGPYGGETVLEKNGDVAFSKDGHHVLNKVRYEDPVQSTILDLLFKIASQVNIKAGDGTTTASVGAYQLYKAIRNVVKESGLRPKDLVNTINKIVDEICVEIQDNAVQIDKDGNLDEIYNLAMVSTNGEHEISKMLQSIYQETGNPVIEYNISNSLNNSYEIVDGYKMPFMKYIDGIFMNNDNGTCVLEQPLVLMFNHKLDLKYYDKIIRPAVNEAIQRNTRVVIIAPFYDTFLLQKIKTELTPEYRATGSTRAVYVRASLMNNHLQDLYGDLAALLGCTILDEQTAYDACKEEENFNVKEFLGSVDEMIISDKTTYSRGFSNKDEYMVEVLKKDARAKYEEILESTEKATHITQAFIDRKQRIAKLDCHMGIINVGGTTELAKVANYDLVEDAVKACECSYLYGYVPGQTIGLQTAIKNLLHDCRPKSEKVILQAISDAYANVTKILLENKFDNVDLDQVKEMIGECVNGQEVIDLNNTEQLEDGRFNVAYTNIVINSCKTDIEILRATAGIIGLLLSSNQFVSIRVQN